MFDEPTAHIDLATDKLLQTLLASRFKDATVLTVAHRLRTVVASDLVLVMDKGQCVEEGSPSELLV